MFLNDILRVRQIFCFYYNIINKVDGDLRSFISKYVNYIRLEKDIQ